MFGEFHDMLNFITLAPFFIIGAFGTVFTLVKVAQSEMLYQWTLSQMDEWRAKQVRKVRSEMVADISFFLRGRREQDLTLRELRIYDRMLGSYQEQLERLYDSGNNTADKVKEDV